MNKDFGFENLSRIYLSAKEVQGRFLEARGLSVSRTTLDIWEGEGMELLRRRGRKWYRWDEVWAWFTTGKHSTSGFGSVS